MDKRGVFLLLLLLGLGPASLFAQKENNIWYFGTKVGLDFNFNPPKKLYNSSMSTSEGCSSVSDSAGNLLFYTSGTSVWSKNHAFMENGTGLKGNSSSTQSSVTVKKPGSTTIYYIFTGDCNEDPVNGIFYSIVDLAYNGGLGKVTEKNKKLYNGPSTEKIACVKNADGLSFWIITHALGSNAFYTYKFSAAGVEAVPVVSYSGKVYTKSPMAGMVGYLKASPDGKKLASCLWGGATPSLELFNFNNATGVVSGGFVLDKNSADNFYGCSFSPDSKLLYAANTVPRRIYQYDVSLPDSQQIRNSRFTVYSNLTGGSAFGALQVAPDKKMYVANTGSQRLSVINNPDIKGPGCNFYDTAMVFDTGLVMFGLPNFIDDPVPFVIEQFSLGPDTFLCPPHTSYTIGFPGGLGPGFGFQWSNESSAPTIDVSTSGTYWVDVTTPNGVVRDYITVIFYPDLSLINLLGNDTVLCTKPAPLSAFYLPHLNYRWSTGATTATATIAESGKYWVEAYTPCDTIRDSINVTFIDKIAPITVNDTLICDSQVTLTVPFVPGAVYSWSTGAATPSATIKTSGPYWVQAKNSCNTEQAFFTVELVKDEITSINLGNDTLLCTDSIVLDPGGINKARYQWSTGDTTQTYTVDSTGTYRLEVTTYGCNSKLRDTIRVVIFNTQPPLLPNDSDWCRHVFKPIMLAPKGEYSRFTWHDGSNAASYTAASTGEYYLESRDTCGYQYRDTFRLVITDCNCELYVPTAFTPDGDGINDRFVVNEYCGLNKYHLCIYSRWGELLFETRDPLAGWEGDYKNYPLPDGVYLVMISYGFMNLPSFPDYKGTVTIMR